MRIDYYERGYWSCRDQTSSVYPLRVGCTFPGQETDCGADEPPRLPPSNENPARLLLSVPTEHGETSTGRQARRKKASKASTGRGSGWSFGRLLAHFSLCSKGSTTGCSRSCLLIGFGPWTVRSVVAVNFTCLSPGFAQFLYIDLYGCICRTAVCEARRRLPRCESRVESM